MSNSLKAIPIVVHFQQSQVSLGYRRGIEQKWDQIQFGVAFEIHVPYISQDFVAKKKGQIGLLRGKYDFVFLSLPNLTIFFDVVFDEFFERIC